jgi:hypothetical protein
VIVRRRARTAIAAAAVVILVSLVGAPIAAAAPAAVPAAAAAAPSPTAGDPPLDVTLGPLQVGITLPLGLGGLLNPIATPTPTPTPGRPTRPAPTPATPSGTSAYPPTLPGPPTSWDGPGDHQPGGGAGSAARSAPGSVAARPSGARPTHRTTHPQPSSSPAKPPRPTATKHRSPAIVFLTGAVPGNASLLLILLCIACAVGVGFVVRLSGGRRRL